jgi:pre-mRNA-splicing factor ISY1
MGEHAIRDLNDSINKLIREKWHWNRRIKELGGKDYNKEERKAMLLAEQEGGTGPDGGEDVQLAAGLGLKGSGGYRYFGAAKDLPGVKELFARHAAKMTKRKRGDIYKYITPDYYGLRDEEDGVLLELEGKMAEDRQEKLKICREEYMELKRKQCQGMGVESDESADEGAFLEEIESGIAASVAVPSQEVVAKVLLQKKREALLNRFM